MALMSMLSPSAGSSGGDMTNGVMTGGSSGGGTQTGIPAGTGMAVGSMFGPWGMAAGAAFDLINGSGGGSATSSPAGPSSAFQENAQSFDNSGWTVSTGSSKASAAAGLALPSWGIPAMVGLGLIVWLKTNRKN